MAIHLRERPRAAARAPRFGRLGWGVALVAVCLVGMGGGLRYLTTPAGPSSRAADHAARKKPPTRTAAHAPGAGASGRTVRVIPTDPTPVASIARPGPEPVVIRPSSRPFSDVQRASGPAYQGFRVVAGR